MIVLAALLAAMSIWEYPDRQLQHEQLRARFVTAMREHDVASRLEHCTKAVELLPDDPIWRYNLACSLAVAGRRDEAFDTLEQAIDLGLRDVAMIRGDEDFKRISGDARFAELLEYAEERSHRPQITGPNAAVPATGEFGRTVVIGGQNLNWDFEGGAFAVAMKLQGGTNALYTGFLYSNRDLGHSVLKTADFPGLTPVAYDSEVRNHHADVDAASMIFPYPLFGNASRAYIDPKFWRSIPRLMMTADAARLSRQVKIYLSNQIWAYPANADCPPVGTNGDVFASITPYWLVTAGASWSDQPYLRAALTAAGALPAATRAAVVDKGLLAPTVMTLIRKSLAGVTNETEYLSVRAHPSALPPGGCDFGRLKRLAAALTPEAVPPLVPLTLALHAPEHRPDLSEVTYVTPFASAVVLRSDDAKRVFTVCARGAGEYAFSLVRDGAGAAKLERPRPDTASIVIDRQRMTVSNRVDLAVFGRDSGTGWGAPSYVSIAVMDAAAPYSDPVLTR